MNLDKSRHAVDNASRALHAAPSDPYLIRQLADATAILGFESGFSPETNESYAILLDDAITLYESALAISPNDGVTLNNLGVAQSDRGFHSAAVATLLRATVLIPLDRNVHFNLAVALMNTSAEGRADARSHFETASKLHPGRETRESYFDPQGH